MTAIILNEPGDTSKLVITELSVPEINVQEVLIRVKAISINPVDVKTRQGKGVYGRLKETHPLVIGWDISGIVEKTGSAVVDFKAGDEVFGMVNFPGHGKAYAEYVAAPASQLALKPLNISFEEAAASTLAALTAYQALVKKAQVKSFQKVLIHAASGGVGHFAAQLAKHLGTYIIATSSEKNRAFVLGLGVDEHIDYQGDELDGKVGQVDFVLDTVGAENIERSLPLIKRGGTLISIPTGISEHARALADQLGVEAYFFLVESNGEDMKAIAELLSRGILKAHVSKVFPFEQMGEAHLAVESGRTVGKVVVTI
jgi:NADPH:quinone reductase-like Zn-dependent oxidoreductase